MRKLIFTLIAIFAALFVGDRLVGKAMWWVIQHSKDITAPKLKYLAGETDDDLIFIGTSRCNHHYVTRILEDSLGMTAYNGGINASENIYAQYSILNILLKHHTPKAIVLDLMDSYYSVQHDPFKALSFFAPYVGNNEATDSLFRLAGTYNLYMTSHVLRYNAKAVSNLAGLVYSRNSKSEKGYIPAPKPPKFPSDKRELKAGKIDSLKLKYMQKFIDKCKESDIKLVFCISPMYRDVAVDTYRPLYDIARTNDIPLLDYHSAGLYLDHPEYFLDAWHLWDRGAREFSAILAKDLKLLLGNKW